MQIAFDSITHTKRTSKASMQNASATSNKWQNGFARENNAVGIAL